MTIFWVLGVKYNEMDLKKSEDGLGNFQNPENFWGPEN